MTNLLIINVEITHEIFSQVSSKFNCVKKVDFMCKMFLIDFITPPFRFFF